MRSSTPKVLHALGGRSRCSATCSPPPRRWAPAHTVVVVGAGREAVEEHLAADRPATRVPVLQEEQRGSGHAAAVALDARARGRRARCCCVNGDAPAAARRDRAPTWSRRTLAAGSVLTVLTAEVADPTGLGRIVRDDDGAVRAIVEERDATAGAARHPRDQRRRLRRRRRGAAPDALARLGADNDQGEQYLTDVLGLLVAEGAPVGGVRAADPDDVLGCNDQRELAARRRTLNDRVLDAADGRPASPSSTRRPPGSTSPPRSRPTPSCSRAPSCSGATHGRRRRRRRAGHHAARLRGRRRARRSSASHCQLARRSGPGATVGPFSYLRPGHPAGRRRQGRARSSRRRTPRSARARRCRTCPTSATRRSARAPTSARRRSSSTTTGSPSTARRSATTCASASDTMLVAPVTVGDGAYTAAGSVITDGRAARGPWPSRGRRQRNVGGWVRRRRPGTAAADAAAAAEAGGRGRRTSGRPPTQ